MTTAATPVRRTPHLTGTEVASVRALAGAAGDADGTYPLSEHVTLHLRYGGDAPAVHLLAREDDGTLVGYAHIDPTDAVEGPSAEVVVHPMRRRRGLGRTLVAAALAAAAEHDPAGRLRLWAHGDHPSASALALSMGFERRRVLWQMRRPLYAPVPAPDPVPGVTIRPFRPGEDDAAWVAVNNRAFADHPDQGGWTLADLRVRVAEPWFDPAGFLLAEASGEPWLGRVKARPDDEGSRLLGFHWTKVHGDVEPPAGGRHAHDPIGEVYVLGLDPLARGSGLAVALTLAGLRHLRGRGLDQVMLYVDESNQRAVALYRGLGFVRWSTDVEFVRRG
jgi:mycothiol synthase